MAVRPFADGPVAGTGELDALCLGRRPALCQAALDEFGERVGDGRFGLGLSWPMLLGANTRVPLLLPTLQPGPGIP